MVYGTYLYNAISSTEVKVLLLTLTTQLQLQIFPSDTPAEISEKCCHQVLTPVICRSTFEREKARGAASPELF